MRSFVMFGNVILGVYRIKLENYTWSKMRNRGEEPLPRYGHTCVSYKSKLIIYGGATPYDPYRVREDILVFDTGNLISSRF
jgi:hypothetical protein